MAKHPAAVALCAQCARAEEFHPTGDGGGSFNPIQLRAGLCAACRCHNSEAAASLGRLGGKAKTAAKAAASRENGKKGGRPKCKPQKEQR
jgi:hypothetical protein